MLAGRFTGEYPFFRGAPATMAGVSAAWSFDRFFDERQSPPVKEEQGQPLQQQKGHGKEDGLERGKRSAMPLKMRRLSSCTLSREWMR